jgi:hypothetical protein
MSPSQLMGMPRYYIAIPPEVEKKVLTEGDR